MDSRPTYSSRLTITAVSGGNLDDESAWPDGPWQPASAVTDADDPEPAEFRRRVVDPIVSSVLTSDELESVVVFEGAGHEVRVTVVAMGETSYHRLQAPRSLPANDAELAARSAQFAFELEDFVAESGFAWGEQRIARPDFPRHRCSPCRDATRFERSDRWPRAAAHPTDATSADSGRSN